MIEIFRFNQKWRLKIISETLEFKDIQDLQKTLDIFLKLKAGKEPYEKPRK